MWTWLLCLSTAGTIVAGDPERRDPAEGAKAHQVFAWESKNGLRYTWCLPEDYEPSAPRNLTLILHGTGLDYRWGHWNNKPGLFRPDDVVVSLDGPSPNGESRLFLGELDDAKAVREFLAEMRATFAVERVFLYGHSQGGFFVVYFAGEFPAEVAGVVAHASGAWNWSKMGKSAHPVAISFMHGTADPVVPFGQSPGSRDAYVEAGFPRVHLRRLEQYNHWPNAVRANEELAWCQGMTTRDAADALACAREILRPKGADDYQWETAVGFSAARDVLRRLVGSGPEPLAGVEPALAAEARELIDALEAHAKLHVDELRSDLASNKSLALDGRAWLGHLVALREDFRGVDAVEAFVAELGYDKRAAAHTKKAGTVLDAWYQEQDAGKQYAAIVGALGESYLFEGFPPEMGAKLAEWRKAEKKLGASKKASKQYEQVEQWRAGWKDGLEQYRSLWRRWKLP